VADFLRGKNGPKVRRGILNGKRVDYFKGESGQSDLKGSMRLPVLSGWGEDALSVRSCADCSGKTAIRTLLGPAYAKVKKAPKVTDEAEAKELLNKALPQ